MNLIKIFFLVTMLTSCDFNNEIAVKSDIEKIKNFLLVKHKIKLSNKVNKLFVLTSYGCHSCNKKFSELIQNNLQQENSFFIITANGNSIDLTPFLGFKNNLIINNSVIDTTLNILNETKVIYFKNNKIDTIVTIDARQLENQFQIIQNRK